MPAATGEKRFCEKCNRTKSVGDFYRSKNTEKYPDDGLMNICKTCMTMHVDNWDPETYMWILQEADVPYIPDEWNALMLKFAQDATKVTGTTIIGRYLSKMKLKQWTKYRWKDTDFLQELKNKEIREKMESQGYDEQAIAQVLDKRTFEVPDQPLEIPEFTPEEIAAAQGPLKLGVDAPPRPQVSASAGSYLQDQLDKEQNEFEGLSDEDKTYLRMKWGSSYHPEEWVQLEQFYKEMEQSFDIQTASQIDTLKFICKTSLKMHHAIDMDDVEAFQKYSKVYDSLMKAGKFTAAQNKDDEHGIIDSLGELFALCEKAGYVERFYVTQPNDKVDETINDMKRYTKELIDGETNLNNLIEHALKENAREDEARKQNEESEIIDSDDMSINDIEKLINQQTELKVEDYNDFNDFEEENRKKDEEVYGGKGDT